MKAIDIFPRAAYDLSRDQGQGPPPHAMKAIIYCRVSSKEQMEGTSLDSQRMACEEFARAKGMTVAKIFIEQGESAKFADRTQLLQLIEFCREQKSIDVLLVWKVDRFARNVADHYNIKATLAKYGVRVVSVTEPIDANPEGKLMETILAGFAQFDNDIRAMRSVQGMRRKIREGIFPWKPPLGYKSPRVGRDKKNEPDQPDQPLFGLLQKVWQEFATGAYTKAEIRRLMSTWGITSSRGGLLPNPSVDFMFANPYYAGVVVDPWSKEEYKGRHTPMVSREEFARIQQIIRGRNRSLVHVKHRKEFPLRGFVRCPACRSYLTGSSSRGRSRYYSYYHCRNPGCQLRGRGFPVEEVDREFKRFLNDIAPRPSVFETLRSHIESAWHSRNATLQSRRERAVSVGAQVDREVQELIRMRTQGLIGDLEFQTHRNTLRERQRMAESIPTEDVDTSPQELHKKVEELSVKLYQLDRTWEAMPMSHRPRFQRMIMPIGFIPEKVRTAEIGLLFRLEAVFSESENGHVPLTASTWNHIYEEIQALYRLFRSLDEDKDNTKRAV